ncbi:MAG: hypothetical protein B6I20_05580 [Bacteroidetes bacterium 4572_117]|nr:MAG: hypothetical protein B6I20_05580 [Bacteroidetes bacterium 4572_117]
MLPGVIINIENGALGGAPGTSDGITGMMLSGVAVASQIALNEPKQIFSLAGAVALGLDEAYDTANSVDVYKQIKSFYDVAGTGKELWFMLVAQTVSLADMLDVTEAANAVALLDAADGKIRVLAVSRVADGGYTPTILDGLDSDVYAAVTTGQALAESFAAQIKPLRVVIGAREWSGAAGDLADLHQRTDNRVAISLTGHSSSNKNADVGVMLGRLAAIPVQRNIGRVKDGDLGILQAYLTDGETTESKETAWASIYDKGFVFVRRYVGKSGYYFVDDLTATALTDDFCTLSKGRVIDKAFTLTYATYINEVNDEVLINTDGTLSAAYVKSLQAAIENVLNQAMTAKNEISAAKCSIDETQNILATNNLVVSIRVTPVGYSKEIEINLGFNNPLNN